MELLKDKICLEFILKKNKTLTFIYQHINKKKLAKNVTLLQDFSIAWSLTKDAVKLTLLSNFPSFLCTNNSLCLQQQSVTLQCNYYSGLMYLIYIYPIMRTMCSPGYHRNSFAATHALRHMMILRSSCFCEIWGLCVSWITCDHLYIYISI